MITIHRKNTPLELVRGLTAKEFQCKCGLHSCKSFLVDTELLDAYHKLRSEIDKPLTINSGYRCPSHNEDVGGAALSQHQLGRAIDIKFKFNKLEIKDFAAMATRAGFTFIRFYPGEKAFFHLDIRRY